MTLTYNLSNHYECHWVTLHSDKSRCVFVPAGYTMRCPAAHGEGMLLGRHDRERSMRRDEGYVVFRYVDTRSYRRQRTRHALARRCSDAEHDPANAGRFQGVVEGSRFDGGWYEGRRDSTISRHTPHARAPWFSTDAIPLSVHELDMRRPTSLLLDSMFLHSSSLCLAAVFATSVLAQVPHGAAVYSHFFPQGGTGGLGIVTRGGTVTVITGLGATPRRGEVAAVAIDPIDNRVWIGGMNTSSGLLHHLVITGSTFSALTQHGPNIGAGSFTGISGIAFDVNCNPVVVSGGVEGMGGVFRLARANGAVTRLVGGPTWPYAPGIALSICSDPLGNLYFGVTGGPAGMGARVYRLAPPGYASPGVFEGWASPPSGETTITGVTWAPDAASLRGAIYWTTRGPSFPVGKLVLAANPPVASVGITLSRGIAGSSSEGVAYDAEAGDLWAISSGNSLGAVGEAYNLTLGGTVTRVVSLPPSGGTGRLTSIDVNSGPRNDLTLCPQFVSAAETYTIELSVTGIPGDVGAFAIIAPVPLLLGLEAIGPRGKVNFRIPNVNIPPGTPGVITFMAGSISPSGALRGLSTPQSWPRN